MSIEIIADEAMNAPLTRIFEEGGVGDVIFVSAELLAPNRSALNGLNLALARVTEGRPMLIITCFDFQSDKLMGDSRYHALHVCPNVEFLRMPASGAELVAAAKRLGNSSKPADPLALAMAGVPDFDRLVGVLKHDLDNSVRANDQAKITLIVEQARQAGFVGTDEEIKSSIQTNEPVSTQAFAGQRYPDVFCDIEGTLLVGETINESIVEYLRKQSQTRPITIWTGGDVNSYRRLLAKSLPWKVVSKWQMGGVTVATAIDDEPQASLEARYGFTIEQHISASNFGFQ